MFKQTWWDKNLSNRMNEFLGWIGDSSSESKVFFRKLLQNKYSDCKTILDVGCGPATEFFAFQEENSDLKYTGLDSSSILYERNKQLGVPMIFSESHSIPVKDSSYDIVFSRHVLEHQPDFKPQLSEMIRCSSKAVFHIFFIKPSIDQNINYDSNDNLYHNRFSQIEIESYLNSHQKIDSYSWEDINKDENILIINIKSNL